MNNWIPIEEFYKLGYAGIVWVTDGKEVEMVVFNGKSFHQLECDRYPYLSPVKKVIPIPEPKL